MGFLKRADGIHVLVSFPILTSCFSSLSEKFSLGNVFGRGIERLTKGYIKPEDCLKNRSSTKAEGMNQKNREFIGYFVPENSEEK